MMVAADTDSKSAMRARFEAFEGTKLYDLVAALPFIAWCVVYVSTQISGFLRSLTATDLRSADAMFFAQAASTGASIVFISFVIALLVVRRSPRGKAHGLFPRFAAVVAKPARSECPANFSGSSPARSAQRLTIRATLEG